MKEIETYFNKLKTQYGEKIQQIEIIDDCLKIHIDKNNLIEIMEFIASELKFPSLEAVSGVDWETYFEVVYHIDRWDGDPTIIQVHVKLENRDDPEIPSITSIWASADWHEREVFDLYGIKIKNHPNLKRLLLPEEWDEYEHKHISELYPMRREYQLPEKPFSFKPQLK